MRCHFLSLNMLFDDTLGLVQSLSRRTYLTTDERIEFCIIGRNIDYYIVFLEFCCYFKFNLKLWLEYIATLQYYFLYVLGKCSTTQWAWSTYSVESNQEICVITYFLVNWGVITTKIVFGLRNIWTICQQQQKILQNFKAKID